MHPEGTLELAVSSSQQEEVISFCLPRNEGGGAYVLDFERFRSALHTYCCNHRSYHRHC